MVRARTRKKILRYEKPNRMKKRYYSLLTLALLLCIFIIGNSLILNVLKIISYQGKIKELQKYQIEAASKNKNLKKQLNDLDARSYEAIARNNLKMAGEDEILIIIHEPEKEAASAKKDKHEKNNKKQKEKKDLQ